MSKLVQLTPAQVSYRWEDLSNKFVNSLDPLVAGQESIRQTAMLELVNRDMSHVWAVVVNDKPICFIYTTFEYDAVTRSKNLLIYTITSIDYLTVPIWRDTISGLINFAKSLNCLAVTMFTKSPKLINMMNSVGGKVDDRYIYKEVL